MYEIIIPKSVQKQIDEIPNIYINTFYRHLDDLKINPRPHGYIKLTGSDTAYRVRFGKYRILYEIYDNTLIIKIIKVEHRKQVYR